MRKDVLNKDNLPKYLAAFIEKENLVVKQVAKAISCSIASLQRIIGGVSLPSENMLKQSALMLALGFKRFNKLSKSDKEKIAKNIVTLSSTALGFGAIPLAISASGIAGLSGAGITSGLAAIGGLIGEGIVVGTVLTAAIPLAAGALGYSIFVVVKNLIDNKKLNTQEFDNKWEVQKPVKQISSKPIKPIKKAYKPKANWQVSRRQYMADLNVKAGITSFGKAFIKGGTYKHIITFDKNNNYNLLGEQRILDEVLARDKKGKGVGLKRVLTNTLSSQACCFNLFTPLKFKENKDLANKLFSKLLDKEVVVTKIDIEFTPEINESIGDQSKFGGTDADVAVFYNDGKKQGVILIEFKYVEAEFSVCNSYKNKNGTNNSKNIRTKCDNGFYDNQIVKNLDKKASSYECGYLKYDNWQLTNNSNVFDKSKIIKQTACPFRFSLNQLWRNMLLAEQVAKARELDEYHFWVLAPSENKKLWQNHGQDVKTVFKSILSEKGKTAFRSLDLDNDVLSTLESNSKVKWSKQWLQKFRNKYLNESL